MKKLNQYDVEDILERYQTKVRCAMNNEDLKEAVLEMKEELDIRRIEFTEKER